MSLNNVFKIASSGMTAQSMRLNVVASNIANVESAVASNGDPYKARRVVFTPIPVRPGLTQVTGVRVTAVVEDQSPPKMKYDPGHPLANEQGYVVMPNINPVEEMADMIAASRAYQTNVEMVNNTKTLLRAALGIGQN